MIHRVLEVLEIGLGRDICLKQATAATSCHLVCAEASSRHGHRPLLGIIGLTFAPGCAVKDHGGDPGREPAYWPAWPCDSAQSMK